MEDAALDLVEAQLVDDPLHAGPELVVAVAGLLEHPDARLDGGQELLAGRELLERQRGVGVGAEAAGDEHAEPGLDLAGLVRAGHCNDADVVEHGLAAVGDAAGEVDLELPGEALADRVPEEVAEGGLGPGLDVEDLVGAGAGEVAAHDVADRVGACLAGGHADHRQLLEDLGDLLELHEVELDVLAGGQVAPAAGEVVGQVGHLLELDRVDVAVGGLHPDHLVVATLALAVDAVGQPEHLEDVLVDLAGQVTGELLAELGDVGGHAGVDLNGGHLGPQNVGEWALLQQI